MPRSTQGYSSSDRGNCPPVERIMFGLFGGKDWNVIGIIFERPDLYRVNGNRGKGGDAKTMRESVRHHPRTIFWAVFDQKGAFLEGAQGQAANLIPGPIVQRLEREAMSNPTVREVLAILEKGKESKISKNLVWGGYPVKPDHSR